MVDRIRYTSILGYALIIEINLSISINCNILKKSVTSDCFVDIRLRFFIKVDNLSIASALKVEHTLVIPAMLIITDKKTLRIC